MVRPITTTRAALVFAGLLALAALPKPRVVDVPDQAANHVWSAYLSDNFAPVMADCVRFEVEGHVSGIELEQLLARAGGDPRFSPRLSAIVDRSKQRCMKRHLVIEAGD